MRKLVNKVLKIYKRQEEVWNYLIIGGLTTLVNIITKYILLFTILDAKKPNELQISIIISWIVAVLFAYITNRKIVFKSKNSKIFKEFIGFIGSRVLTLIVEMLFMYVFVTLLKLDTSVMVAILSIVGQIIVIILNYVFSKLFVFKKK